MNKELQIRWSNQFALGDPLIDEQHKEFFTIAQKAHNLHTIQNDKEKVLELRKLMTELFKYINFHFDTEEIFMRNINYPHMDEHLLLHKRMKDKLNFINFNLMNMEISQAERRLYHFVQTIFVEHITHEDMKVVKFRKNLY